MLVNMAQFRLIRTLLLLTLSGYKTLDIVHRIASTTLALKLPLVDLLAWHSLYV